MSRVAIPKREDAPAESQAILDNVEKMLGFVPNLQRLMSISPRTPWQGGLLLWSTSRRRSTSKPGTVSRWRFRMRTDANTVWPPQLHLR
jgi:hypothetical protein